MDTTNAVAAANPIAVTGAKDFSTDILWDFLARLLDYVPTLIAACLILYVGLKISHFLAKLVGKIMEKRNVEKTVVGFVEKIVHISLQIIVIITFIGILGIPTTSFIAMIGAAGLAIGMALQGSLQNFAGGVIILILKPFKIGDFIDFGGEKGTVVAINIFNTVVERATTNETVIIPNGSVSSSTLINWKKERIRRVESPFSIAYGEDIAKVRAIIIAMANKDERVLQDKGVNVVVTALADSSVNLELRVWIEPVHYFDVAADMLEKIYNTLNENNIEIPFPQLDVKIKA